MDTDSLQMDQLEQAILYEDSALVVINKPAGFVVNRSETYEGLTVQEWMEKRLQGSLTTSTRLTSGESTEYGTPDEIFASRGGIVHRLDKDTSGILLLAKTADALVNLLAQFKARQVEKTYVALVHGKLVPSAGVIRLPMDRSRGDRKKFAVTAGGRLSETQYQLLKYFPNLPKGIYPKKGKSYQGFSLVELTPRTGRTHQIRVHMAAIHHPLVADQTYGGRKRIAIDLEWCLRHFLHAKTIACMHPTSQELIRFEAPLPKDLQTALKKLED